MTTDTVTPAVDAAAPPASAPATTSNTYSVIGLVLSILSIPLGMAVLAIAGIVIGFVARAREPLSRTTANVGIVLGFVSLFGGVILAILGLIAFAPFAVGFWMWDIW